VTRGTTQRLAGRRVRCLLVAALAAGAVGLSADPALAVAKWGVTTEYHNPYGAPEQVASCPGGVESLAGEPCGVDPFSGSGKSFARESGWNTYTIKVKNDGEESVGPVTVVDDLPAGIVFSGLSGFEGDGISAGIEWKCKVTDAGHAECSTSEPLPTGASFAPIELHVHVTRQATNPSVNVAKLSKGGAVLAESTSETTVTEAVPFGIESFTTEVFKELTEPLSEPFSSQAGGHPFAVSNELVFNYTTGDEQGRLVTAAGAAKEVQVELPPGFIGNPQNAPRCPIHLLAGNHCPANTAVGYTRVVISNVAKIVGGKAVIFPALPPFEEAGFRSLVYNMEPAPGYPAEFGFVVIAGVPFVLEAKVRSDGDYGVTVGDSAVGEKPVAINVTFCENGAHGESPNLSCNAAPPNSEPFLSNPTECSASAPVWTLRANTWYEPADYVSKTVDVNLVAGAPSKDSFVTGCESLQFHPEIEFKPSPASEGGTTQADEPTGMALDLKVPQTNEAGVKATPDLKNAVLKLPPGMTVSPSAADGLQACSNAQFGLGTEFGPGSKHTEPAKPASCPLASQIGTVEVFSPLLSGAPTIEGIPGKNPKPPHVNEGLTCSQGAWSGSPALSYQWLRDGVAIENATGREYAPVAADEGKALQCLVTATNAGGRSVAVSRDVVGLPEPATVPPFPPSSIAAPSGTASAGNTLTCAPGAWTSGEAPAFTYQWLRGGVAIAGANTNSYTLTSEDEGKVIQCQVTGSNSFGSAIADSAAVVSSPQPSTPPLPGAALQGQLFVAEPECSPCTNEDAEDGKLLRLFLQAQDPSAGVIVKLHGTTSANTETGQLTTTFEQQPQQPFELLQLQLKGGPRAVLANPQSCGPATTSADLTPWSAPFTPDATPTSTYNVDFNGAGGACPGAPFNPSFNAGTTGANATAADASSSFSLTLSRQDREQDLSAVQVHMPLGLVGKIAGIPQCGEAQANAGTCGPESQIGTAESGAGPGPDPFFEKGRVYLTGPYKGAPFGLSVVTPAVAGPFNLGDVVVRAAISIDPHTAAVTVTSDPLPQIIDGVPLRLRVVNVNVNRSGFMLNPTNCSEQQVSATLSSAQGASAQVSSPFGLGGCTSLPFKPTFTASTQAHTSKAGGASLDVRVTYPPGGYANIAKTVTELPKALPSRLTTLQKACVDAVFEANPAACPEGSVVGSATAHTPLLNVPLSGPAYLVSHGGAAFPDLEIVLQGEGVEVILDGQTDIEKGITKTSFNAIPDSPIETFELNLPEGPHSVLAANVAPCSTKLNLPTILTGQNGAVIKQTTKIAVTGCPPTVGIAKTKVEGNTLLVTVKTSTKGTVRISGRGLKTVTKKNLNPGTHQVRVTLTKTGRSMRSHHKKVSVRVSLTVVGTPAVAKTTTVRL
jgi:hypothetical protein